MWEVHLILRVIELHLIFSNIDDKMTSPIEHINTDDFMELLTHLCAVVLRDLPDEPTQRMVEELKFLRDCTREGEINPGKLCRFLNEEELGAIYDCLIQNGDIGAPSGTVRDSFKGLSVSSRIAKQVETIELPDHVDKSTYIRIATALTDF